MLPSPRAGEERTADQRPDAGDEEQPHGAGKRRPVEVEVVEQDGHGSPSLTLGGAVTGVAVLDGDLASSVNAPPR